MRIIKVVAAGIIFTMISATELFSQIRLPRIISDGMVIQREAAISIWGWAAPNEKISVMIDGRKYQTSATPAGTWTVKLRPMDPGGPHVMIVSGKKDRVTVRDILVGDVWLCAGQSNMVHQMDIHDVTYAADIANANEPAIRHFKIPTTPDLNGSRDDLEGGAWQSAVGEDVRPFSAVAYFFAREIQKRYGIPIGLINASVGGTPVETWISEQGFSGYPETMAIVRENKDTARVGELSRSDRRSVGTPRMVTDKG